MQSQACFQGILQDQNFGDLFVGNHRPEQIDHLFLSIQTFNSQDWSSKTSADFYDYILVDEFHHAAAASYQQLLAYYQPKVLLGLTATPERMDGKDILQYFGGHPTAELRLPEAIERSMLCPFRYFGVTDNVDLRPLRWENGGYAKTELTNVYALQTKTAQRRAELILQSIEHYTTDVSRIRGVGFCVSVKHAEFMADYFNQKGVPSRCLTGKSSDELREQAKQELMEGRIRFIFVVDLYNEGVDIPAIDTILFLRPTESLTIFLQQLGRGLRLADGKECLTVLDFIGQANKKYRFEEKFSALLNNSNRRVVDEIRHGFTAVPHGCYVQLEKKARDYILDNIRATLNNRQGIIQKIRDFTSNTSKELNVINFLSYYCLDIHQLYRKNNKESFARLCVEAGVRENFQEPDEVILTKACKRIVAIDSRRWLQFLRDFLPQIQKRSEHDFTPLENRMRQMFHFTIWQDSVEKAGFSNLRESLQVLERNPILLQEIEDILTYQQEHLDFVDQRCDLGFDCPLDVHCHYTRDQIFAAMDYYKPNTIRQGVFHLPEKKLDVFMVTLNKSDKYYSPSTMYNDYSMNAKLFHWQSQSTTSDTSPTAQRYFHHRENGDRILLFVREYGDDLCGKAPYLFLGTANYVRHNGSRPINIIWQLDVPIPAKFIPATNKLVAE
jgi:superfamily II DNA or RNA helicase